MLKTKKAGNITDSCRGSFPKKYADFIEASNPGLEGQASTCDFLQRHDGVINMEVARNGAPLAVTQAYLGQTDMRDAVSITLPKDTTEIYYDKSKDELALFVEPITGAVITGYERLQTNWYIEKSMIDTTRYANIFSADSDNDDVFVWPFMYIKKEPGIDDKGAKDFISIIYGAYENAFHLDLLGIMMCVICGLSAAICLKVDTAKVFRGRSVEEKAEASAV